MSAQASTTLRAVKQELDKKVKIDVDCFCLDAGLSLSHVRNEFLRVPSGRFALFALDRLLYDAEGVPMPGISESLLLEDNSLKCVEILARGQALSEAEEDEANSTRDALLRCGTVEMDTLVQDFKQHYQQPCTGIIHYCSSDIPDWLVGAGLAAYDKFCGVRLVHSPERHVDQQAQEWYAKQCPDYEVKDRMCYLLVTGERLNVEFACRLLFELLNLAYNLPVLLREQGKGRHQKEASWIDSYRYTFVQAVMSRVHDVNKAHVVKGEKGAKAALERSYNVGCDLIKNMNVRPCTKRLRKDIKVLEEANEDAARFTIQRRML